VRHALKVLADRIGDLEALVRESNDELGKVKKQLAELKTVVAKKKQLKKLKKVLDQLEVVEVGEDAPSNGEVSDPKSEAK
jgi:hypothetical protein